MDVSTQQGVAIKIFMGCLLSPDIKRLLYKSSSWKEAKITWQSSSSGLKEIRYQGHDYVGVYLDKELVTLGELKDVEELVKSTLKQHCPDLDRESCHLSLFSQLLVS